MTGRPLFSLEDRVAAVKDRIVAACVRSGRDPESVTLVAVTKGVVAERIVEAMQAGIADFGENYVQEALPKRAAVIEGAAASDIQAPCFHFIGHLQSNKAKAVADAFAILHGVDSSRLLDALVAHSAGTVEVMLQVNLAGEATKHGLAPLEIEPLLTHSRALGSHVRVRGLMTIPPPGPVDITRGYFRELRRLARDHGLSDLSMGMSDDFEAAVEEGATHVRVGRAIFGERA